jgi:hypothetical protein
MMASIIVQVVTEDKQETSGILSRYATAVNNGAESMMNK